MKLFKKTVVGLELTDYSAQLIEISTHNNQIYLEAFNRLLIPPGLIKNGEIVKENELRMVLKTFFEGANPEAVSSRDVAILFPSSKIFTHIFKFPKNLKENEIEQSIKFQAETVIPFSMEEMYWDFTFTNEQENLVLFSAISKNTADAYARLMISLDLNPYIFGGHVEALKYGLIKQIKDQESKLLINIDTLSTNFMILKNGEIVHYFSLNEGGKSLIKKIADEENSIEYEILHQKIQDRLSASQQPLIEEFFNKIYKIGGKIMKEHSKFKKVGPINEVILTGEFLNLPHFLEIAQKHFKKCEISIGDPKNFLKVDEKKFKVFEEYRHHIPYSTYFINTLGIAVRAALSKPNEGLNLIPDDLRSSSQKKKKTILLVVLSVVMTAISLFLATFLFFKHQDLLYQRQLLEIQKSAFDKVVYGTRYQQIISEIKTFNQEIAELAAIDQTIISTDSLINKVLELIPEGVSVSKMVFNDIDLTFTLSGVAATRDSLLDTTKNFSDATFVEEVITPISNFDKKSNISFVIELKLIFKELSYYGRDDV